MFEGNQAPFVVYKAFSQALIFMDIPHREGTVVTLTEFIIPTILFINITAWSVFLYNNTLKIMLTPPPKKPPPPPVPGPGGAIVINQHFGPKPAGGDAAKK